MKATRLKFAITYITGAPGSGKSYVMCRELFARMADFKGRVITNLPINVERFSELAAAKHKRPAEEIAAQFDLVDPETLQRWGNGNSGPWDLLDKFELQTGKREAGGALFVLDECHRFCPKEEPKRQKPWRDWLGEVRHEGWSGIMFITQDDSKVGQAVRSHAELQYEITNAELLRDPFLQIELGYWYELKASIFGEYIGVAALTQYRRKAKRLQVETTQRIALDPWAFELYRSYEAAGGGTEQGETSRNLREWEKRPRVWWRHVNGRRRAPTWAWFVGENIANVTGATLISGAAVYLLAGGWRHVFNAWMGFVVASGSPPSSDLEASIDAVGPPVPAANQFEAPRYDNTASAQLVIDAVGELPDAEQRAAVRYLQSLAELLEDRRERIEELEATDEAIREKEGIRTRVVAIAHRHVAFSDGRNVAVGEVVRGGELDGLRVEKVDAANGMVFMEGDRVLLLGVSGADADGLQAGGDDPADGRPDPARSPRPTPAPPGPGLPDDLRESGGVGRGRERGLLPSTREFGSGRSPLKSVLTDRREADGRLDPGQ